MKFVEVQVKETLIGYVYVEVDEETDDQEIESLALGIFDEGDIFWTDSSIELSVIEDAAGAAETA